LSRIAIFEISDCVVKIIATKKIPFDIGQEYVIRYSNTIDGSIILEKQLRRLFQHLLDGGTIDNPAQMFLPKSMEEEKFDRLSDMSKDILIALAESRKMEIEIVAEKAFLMSPDSVKNVKNDLDKLNKLIDKIKNHSQQHLAKSGADVVTETFRL